MGPTFERWLWEKRGNFELLPFGSSLEFETKKFATPLRALKSSKIESLLADLKSYGDARYFINARKKCWHLHYHKFLTDRQHLASKCARETFGNDRVSPFRTNMGSTRARPVVEDAPINRCKRCNWRTGGRAISIECIYIHSPRQRWKQWHDKVSLELLTMWRKSSVSRRGMRINRGVHHPAL